MEQSFILVGGATGLQGGSVVAALLEIGLPVRALVSNASHAAAQALAARGMEVMEGNYEDIASLKRAAAGATGVFSMQLASSPDDVDREFRQGFNLVKAAKAAGVTSFVHSSVARAGDHTQFVDWEKGRWPVYYWEGKSKVNDAVREANFPHWTILKPSLMMENLLSPKVENMFPSLKNGELITAISPETKVDWVSGRDVGRFAAAAFADPARFDKMEMDLAADSITMGEVAHIIGEVTGKMVKATCVGVDEAEKLGIRRPLAVSQTWLNLEGYQVDVAKCASHGIELENMNTFIYRNREKFKMENQTSLQDLNPLHYTSLNEKIGLQLFTMRTGNGYGKVLIKIKPHTESESLQYLEKTFTKLFSLHPYKYQFQDEKNLKSMNQKPNGNRSCYLELF